jgi:hypothetical protein
MNKISIWRTTHLCIVIKIRGVVGSDYWKNLAEIGEEKSFHIF